MFDLTPQSVGNPDQVRLMVGGKVYGGWLSFSIVRSLEAPSGSFALKVSDRWPGQTAPWPIEPGDECQLNLGGDSLIVGYVDEVEYSLSGETRDQAVNGRDKTGDLVDSSYVGQPDQWINADIATIAAALAQPYGVTVQVKGGGGGAVKNFKVEPGETAFEAIARLCKLKGLLAWPDNRGNLIISPATGESLGVTLAETDCISLSVTHSLVDRHSEYMVKGQRPTIEAGKDAAQAKACSQVKESAQDPGVTRYRPLLIISEGAAAEARERALWEAATRAGRGLKAEITVPGYRAPAGGLWEVGKLIGVKSPGICLADQLLISQVQYELGPQSGHTTTLTLARPDAYKPEPVKAPKGGGGAGGGLPPGTVVY